MQKRIWILKMGTVAITGVYARGLFYKKTIGYHPRGSGDGRICVQNREYCFRHKELPKSTFPARCSHAGGYCPNNFHKAIPRVGHRVAFAFLRVPASQENPILPRKLQNNETAQADELLQIATILPRERRSDEFLRNSTRAPAIKDNRFPLYKPSVSTYPFSLVNAFPQT